MLKRREAFEMEDGGFGQRVINNHESSSSSKKNSTQKKPDNIQQTQKSEEDYTKMIASNIQLMTEIQLETNRLIEECKSKYPESDSMKQLMNKFSLIGNTSTQKGQSSPTASPVGEPSTPCTRMIVTNRNNEEIWGSPGFVKAVIESAEKEEHRMTIAKFLPQMDQPGFDPFDLGISPDKEPAPIQKDESANPGGLKSDIKGKRKCTDIEENTNHVRRDYQKSYF